MAAARNNTLPPHLKPLERLNINRKASALTAVKGAKAGMRKGAFPLKCVMFRLLSDHLQRPWGCLHRSVCALPRLTCEILVQRRVSQMHASLGCLTCHLQAQRNTWRLNCGARSRTRTSLTSTALALFCGSSYRDCWLTTARTRLRLCRMCLLATVCRFRAGARAQ